MEIIQSPINYMGSKFIILDKIIPLFPKDKDTFIDMFTGGGSVYMNISHLYNNVIANDYLIDLIYIHKKLSCDIFINEVKELSDYAKVCKQNFEEIRARYNKEKTPQLLLALIYTCNSNMMRFNRSLQFNQTYGNRGFNKNTLKKLNKYKKNDYSNVSFTSMCFSKFDILNIDNVFVYLDPPYSNTEAGYNSFWDDEKEYKLIKLIDELIKNNIFFGISGVINGKENKVYDYLKDKELYFYYFGDLYKHISKKDKNNKEYYITNVNTENMIGDENLLGGLFQ